MFSYMYWDVYYELLASYHTNNQTKEEYHSILENSE